MESESIKGLKKNIEELERQKLRLKYKIELDEKKMANLEKYESILREKNNKEVESIMKFSDENLRKKIMIQKMIVENLKKTRSKSFFSKFF